MKKITVFLVVLTFLSLIVLSGLTHPSSSMAQTASPISQSTSTITIQNFQFTPQTIQVTPGTTVTWTNLDSTPHTTTADDTNAAESWDSGILNQGQSFSLTFTEPGTYSYHCTLHPTMKGTIQVLAGLTGAISSQGIGSSAPIGQGTQIPRGSSPSDITYNSPTQLPATGPSWQASLLVLGLTVIGLTLSKYGKRQSRQW